MSLAHRCMRQLWFYLYVGPARPNYFKLAGSSGHRALEENFRFKIDKGSDLTVREVQDIFTTAFNRGAEECEKDGGNPARLRDKIALETLPLFLKQEAISIQPKLVEETFSFQAEGISVPITGTVDLFAHDGRLYDWKFRVGARTPSQREVDKSFQLATYSLALTRAGEEVREAVEFQLICHPDRTSEVKPLRTEAPTKVPGPSLLAEYAGVVRFVELARGDPELYPMTNPTNWWCDEKWCGWAEKCPRFGGNHK